MGDAIVDVIASCDDDFLVEHKLPKGSMQLLSPQQADDLYAAMGVAREMSGGSAAKARSQSSITLPKSSALVASFVRS